MSNSTQKPIRKSWMQRVRQPKIWLPAIAILALGGGAFFLTMGGASGTEATQYHRVGRSNMLVSITEGGTLRAAEEISIVSEVEGQATIIYLVPEGTQAQKGDLLIELDSSAIEENLTQRKIAYQTALSDFTEARENFSIKQSESDSEVALAELKVEFAKVDQRKYHEGDFLQSQRNAAGAIQLAKEELTRAEDRLKHTIRLQEEGYATLAELEADKLTVTRRKLELEQAVEKERLLIEYEHPRMVRQLESDLEQAIAALTRARSRGIAQMSQAQANLDSRNATLDLEENRLARVQKQLGKTKIFAPQSGLVIYESNGQQNTPVEEGMTVRERQALIKLPDLSRMVVEVKVHESQVSQVKKGQIALVTIDSIPDRRFRGRVQRVAVLPDSQSRWLNPDLKVYTTEVLVTEPMEDVNPGVSARAEIVVSQLENVLQVPIQAVSTYRGDRVVYQHIEGHPKAISVELGMYNDSFVQIQGGLNEGDSILLSPPKRRSDEDFLPLMLGDGKKLADEIAEQSEGKPATPGPTLKSTDTGRQNQPEAKAVQTPAPKAEKTDGLAKSGTSQSAASSD